MSEGALMKLVEHLQNMAEMQQDDPPGDEMPNEEPMAQSEQVEPAVNEVSPCEQFAEFGGAEAALAKLREVHANEADRKKNLIESLVANEACLLSEAQLSEMTIPTLEAVRNSFVPPDYSGQSGGSPVVNVRSDQPYTMSPLF